MCVILYQSLGDFLGRNLYIQDSRFKIQIYLTIKQTNIQMRNNTKFVNGKDQNEKQINACVDGPL